VNYIHTSTPFYVYQGSEEAPDSGVSLPALDSIESFILLSTVSDVISLYEINRKECAKFLLSLQYAFKVDSVVLGAHGSEDGGEWTLQHAIIQVGVA
jgi:hypothetical protein